MTSYLDTYFSRINHLGTSTAERIRNSGVRSFQKWMAESPHTIRQLSVERGIFFDAIILTHKDKEYEKIMFLNVSNDTPLLIGDIMNWKTDDGILEKWIIIQEEKKVNGTYRTFWIIRCNYLIRWIDKLGHLQQSWCYFVSSLDSKIKGNYRTWHNLITPQPNKYAEILMPRREVDRATSFIVEDESWIVIEYDHTSVPGTVYLSLTEDKINRIYDDTENNIADTNKRANYQIILPEEIQHFPMNTIIHPVFTITKNGIPFNSDKIIYSSSNKKVVYYENEQLLTGNESGQATIRVFIPECDDIEPQELAFDIIVDENATNFDLYIEGPDTIRLTKNGIYTLRSISENIYTVTDANINSTEYATLEYNEALDQYIIYANSQNKLGTVNFNVTISCNNEEKTFTKSIKIIPLW